MDTRSVWIFNGISGRFAGGVFDSIAEAETWISKHRLTGVLTNYPLNTGVYDWALENRSFVPKTAEHTSPEFIGKFTAASQEHFHYENGEKD